jgi:hypothetical protein
MNARQDQLPDREDSEQQTKKQKEEVKKISILEIK